MIVSLASNTAEQIRDPAIQAYNAGRLNEFLKAITKTVLNRGDKSKSERHRVICLMHQQIDQIILEYDGGARRK